MSGRGALSFRQTSMEMETRARDSTVLGIHSTLYLLMFTYIDKLIYEGFVYEGVYSLPKTLDPRIAV